MKAYQLSADYLQQKIGDRKPEIAIILGSGLGSLADVIQDPIFIPYGDIPGFPKSSVHGHKGRLVIGRLGNKEVACMQGRFHVYEGISPETLQIPIRTLKLIGCDTLLLTNAAGSLNEDMGPGSLMLIEDHINFSGVNPLVGENDDSIGPRFQDMTRAYDPELNAGINEVAKGLNINLFKGVYVWALGPSFETPAEIRMFRTLGADAVGMSTVPETIVARHCGMKVAAISSITNLGAGMSGNALSHEETLDEGQKAAAELSKLVIAWLEG